MRTKPSGVFYETSAEADTSPAEIWGSEKALGNQDDAFPTWVTCLHLNLGHLTQAQVQAAHAIGRDQGLITPIVKWSRCRRKKRAQRDEQMCGQQEGRREPVASVSTADLEAQLDHMYSTLGQPLEHSGKVKEATLFSRGVVIEAVKMLMLLYRMC